ncbi:MAG TPA: error-prone DNA polymerase [Arenimonas sp.]|nr:error-prone DNA polymerase [Arenimonas sp.]
MSEWPAYAELHCLSAFSFGRGASSAKELFDRAKAQGYTALAITDECSLAGIVRALEASRESSIPLIVGSELRFDDGLACVLLVEDQTGYTRLCQLITQARRRSRKGCYRVLREDFDDGLTGLLCLWLPGAGPRVADGEWLHARFPGRLWLAVELHRGPDDAARLRQLLALAQSLDIPVVASGDVHMHERSRRRLQDALTAIRVRRPLSEAGAFLYPNGERHLRTRRALSAIYPRALLEESARIAARCRFDLGKLEYRYPRELVPEGYTPASWLRQLTETGARWRWPQGEPAAVRAQLEHELALIADLNYEAYFLTVHDIVRFARSRGILCQGRGSAANSAVCFALGVTEVDPARINLLFERFLSRERDEPPDIDIDFEHERREEVLQYLYDKYGRERAALTAVVIRYRSRSAARDLARAFGFGEDQVAQLARVFAWGQGSAELDTRLRERGFDPHSTVMRCFLDLLAQLHKLPRHLSQHVGGFVISDAPLHELVPVENAAMLDRTIIQWDKDDLDVLGLLKVDCLALGMLTAVRKCFDLLRAQRGLDLSPATVPAEDPTTYAMVSRGETVGVFQIESRAQMAMLPRLRPQCFYDLVIQVAIVRPGPIQGDMVHPFLRRRQGLERVEYPSPELQQVLQRTLGVPLFQEQVMQIAIVAAGYSPGEADALRRAMAAWKRHGTMEHHRQRLLRGMAERGYPADFAERVYAQIEGFSSYGFPESHAASFALLAYVSAWLKCHEPAAFVCALMNAQPLGFYSNSQLLQDLRRRGIALRPVDVRYSDWDNTLEPWPDNPQAQPALRLGLREIAGLAHEAGAAIVAARAKQRFIDVEDLCRRADLDARSRDLLAEAGALRGLAGHRHRARWAVAGVERQLPLFGSAPESAVSLPLPSAQEDLAADYARLGLTLGPHPLALLRSVLRQRRYSASRELERLTHGTPARLVGLVSMRQRPQTASGVTFVTLEDEHGWVNVVVWRDLGERQRRELVEARLLGVAGRLECADGVRHLIAQRLFDETALIDGIDSRSRDYR